MRIVKLSSLSEKERKKVLEEQEERYQQNQQERQRIQKQANDDFVKSFGNGETNLGHTTTYKDILNSMNSKEAKNDFKKRNNLTLWDQVKNIANGGGFITRKTGTGILGGIVGIGQAGLTDTANQLRKGENDKSTNIPVSALDFISSVLNPSRAMNRAMIEGVKNNFSTITNKDKNAMQKAGELFANSASAGANMNQAKATWNTGLQLMGKINNNVDDEVLKVNRKISKPVEELNSKLQEEGKHYDGVTNWLGDAGQTIGNMVPSITASAVTHNPSIGLGVMGISAKGQATQEALNKGADLEQAVKIGDAKMLVEIATEKMAGGTKLLGKGSLDDLADEFIKKGSKSTFGKFLLKQGYNVGGEITEELISDLAGNIIDKGTTEPDKKIVDLKQGLDTTGKTAFTTLVLNGLGGYQQDYNWAKQQTLEQQNQNTDNKDINQEQKVSQNGFLEAEKTETLRQEARNKLESIKQNYDENSYNQMQEFIETAPNEKALSQVINDLNKEVETKQVAPIKQKQEVQLPMKQETQNKSFEDVAFEAMSNYESNEVESPLKNRDMSTIGKQTNVNAYQYDNPKVKPYFQEMAQQMGEDLAYISSSDNRSTQKGGGTKLSATTKAMDILHNEQGYSYNQISQGLQNIIDDKGSENNAISKKIELVIDEQLRNGYTNALGKNIEPNQEYINTITEQYSLAEQPQQNNFKYEQSNNAKVDTFRQDASKYWDNSEKTAKLVNTIEKVINDKGYNIRLNDTIGNNVNGKIVTNQQTGEIEITINPNSNRAGEFILGHELTHAIQTQEMVDLVNNRMQKDGDLRNAVEDLKKLYNTNEVNAEVLADISGQLFGNQEFINNLSVEKPNVFKRIYDKIVSLANKITGNSSEALFIKDLRNKWEQAYRENTNNIKDTQYSKQHYEGIGDIAQFDGIDFMLDKNESIPKNIKQYFKNNFEGLEINNVTLDQGHKYAYPGYKQSNYNEVKAPSVTIIDDIIETMDNQRHEPDKKVTKTGKKKKHSGLDTTGGFNHYDIKIGIPDNNGNVSIYEADSITRIDKNGKEYFYDLDKIKDTGQKVVDNKSKPLTDSSVSSNNSIPQTQEIVNSDTTNYSMQESENNSGSFNLSQNHKQKQNEIIQKNNPMDKTLGEHTWINSADDIKTYQEAIEEFGGIDNITPDFTAEDVKKALDTGKMTVYSSYPIEQGTFVTPSKMEAQSYAGKSQVYSKVISLTDVAWIDEVQGQYAKVDNSQNTSENEINTLTNDGITMTYVRNPNTNTKNYGTTYGQNLEPAGEYMSMDTLKGEYKVPGFEYGTITFKNPLVIEHKDTTEKGWKKDLSDKYNGLTGRELSNAIKKDGYDAIMTQDKDGNFIEIINLNGIKNDTKYSKQNNNWQDYLESNYKSEGTTTDLRDIRLPMKEKQEVKLPMKQENTQQTQEQNNNTKGENINWNEIERPEENRKFRKHYKSIIESDNTTAEAKSIAKELMKTDTYVPETNKGQLAQADERIMTSSPEAELQSLRSRVLNGERITSVDIAVGERLIQYFSKTGSAEQLQDAIQTTALAGTSTGQTLQALTILNHQTPQGQVTWIQRSIEKINKELAKKKGGTITKDEDGNLKIVNKQGKDITDKVKLFDLTPEMMNKIMQSENQEQMLKNIDEVYEELGQQVPKDMIEKIDSWRYFSMLANARTHIRNMVGNVAMGKMQRAKDKIAGGIEDVVSKFNPEMERTKTLRRADKKVKEFAKNDFKNVEVQSRLELNESKFKPQSRLQNARRTFKSDVMENTLGRLFDLNDTLLEAEDGLGLKAGYQKALADYLTANKIDVDNITDAQLGKARNYAIQQAKEATFHQANALASWVSQIGSNNWQAPKGKMAKFFVDAVLPFKKTPMNVAKSGVEYSPVGLLKSAIFDTAKLRKGDISVNQYIDNISKGLTGTGIALTGYALAKAGILKASGGDDKDKEKYDEEQGKQSYSIEIGGKTYSLDWLAPTGIPLFIGAETYKLFNQEENEKGTEKRSEEDRLNQAIKGASNLLNAGATAINPMSEMSMISGLTSALSSYNTQDNLGSLGNIMTNAGKSYINQFFPTLMGQVAKTGDEYERTTKSTATGTIGKAVDQTINQIKNKVPGLRQTLPIKTDIWGKEVKQEVNLPLRAVNNFINPATVKEISTDKVDMELNKLYEENRNSALLPDILTKTVQLNKQTYRLSNKEYAEFTKNYGQTSHKLIENFIKTSDYNKLTQEQKETAISNIYSYAKEQNKLDYAKKVNEEVKPSTLYTTMKEIEKGGGKQSEYLNYLAKTKGISKENEKNKVLADSNYSNKTKEIIYANGTGKDDNLYNNLLSKNNINMTEYLKYKNKLSEKAFGADKDKNGKTIAGSAKAKTINYLNNNITGVGNRLLIAGKSYALQNSEKQKLVEYINSSVSTREERLEIYKQLDKNFTIKNGKVYMKVSKK